MTRKKRVFWGFFNFDYKAIETYLEEMAAKGWMLEKISTSWLFATFRAIEPQQLKFYIDVFKDGGALVPENHPDVETYRRMCEDSGWSFVTSRYHYQIFAAAADECPTPIHTDLQLQQKLVETVLWKGEYISILVSVIILIVSSYWFLNSFSYTGLLFFTGGLTLMIPGLGIYIVLLAAYLLIKILRSKRKIANGQAIEAPTLKSARRRVKALYVPTGVFLMIFLASIVADAFFAPFNIALLFLPMFLALCIGFFFKYLIKDKAKSKAQSKVYALTAILVVVIIFHITASSLFSVILRSRSANPEDYQVITLEALTGVPGEEEHLSFYTGRSPVVPVHYDYSEVRDVDGKKAFIMVKAFHTIHPFFAGIIFDGLAEENHGQGLTSSVDLDLWNADRLLTTGDMGTILLQKDRRVLYIEGNLILDSDYIRSNLHQFID